MRSGASEVPDLSPPPSAAPLAVSVMQTPAADANLSMRYPTHWKQRGGFYFNERHKREWMTDGTLDWLWPAAERAGGPVALARPVVPPTGAPAAAGQTAPQ